MTARTQDEIVARFKAADDWLGFDKEVLAQYLDTEHLAQVDLTPTDGWAPKPDLLEKDSMAYLQFAIDKIESHRGISADRSVTKLREYAWLLSRDDVVEAMDAEDYAQYGAPKVRAFARGMGWTWPDDDKELTRMAEGLPCHDGCESGCGR